MTFPDRSGAPPGWTAPAAPVSELLRLHREQIVAYTTAPPEPAENATVPDGAQAPVVGSSIAPLNPDDLPADLVRLVERYEADHPGVRLTPLRYVRVGGAEPVAAAADGELPAEGELVSLAITESVADSDRVEVRSLVLLAAITTDATG